MCETDVLLFTFYTNIQNGWVMSVSLFSSESKWKTGEEVWGILIEFMLWTIKHSENIEEFC